MKDAKRKTMPPAPVVFLLEDLDFGGTQRQTLELAARLDRKYFSPELVTLRKGGMDLVPRAQALGLPWRSLTDTPGEIDLARALPALWRYLARERPPLLQLLTVLPNIWGRVFGRMLGLPGIIGCCRGVSAVRGQHERFLGWIPRALIGNAEAIRALLVKEARVAEQKVFFIPNGVDSDFFTPSDAAPESPSILCIARMAPVKNHALLLRAFARVLSAMPETELHLAGEGECKAAMQAMACGGEFNGRVHFHPASTDLRPLLRQAQIFALSSDYEGTPNVLLEAMACGLPVVATKAGGNAEAVCHGETGLLVPCRDEEALAGAMLRLLGNAAERADFGRAGRERVLERYSMKAMVGAHERVYDLVLNP